MTTLNNIIAGTNETEIRRNAMAYAESVSYKVSEMYNEASDVFFTLMSEIHENGKEGNYSIAKKYQIVKETLKTWI